MRDLLARMSLGGGIVAGVTDAARHVVAAASSDGAVDWLTPGAMTAMTAGVLFFVNQIRRGELVPKRIAELLERLEVERDDYKRIAAESQQITKQLAKITEDSIEVQRQSAHNNGMLAAMLGNIERLAGGHRNV